MSQSACMSQYFTDLSQIGFSVSNLSVDMSHPGQLRIIANRPWLPMIGIGTAASDTAPDSIANNQANLEVFRILGEQCYQASVNNVQEVAGSVSILNTSYDQYLYKLIFGNAQNINRFAATIAVVPQFWTDLNPLSTPEQLANQLDLLYNRLQDQTDKRYWLPPGEYRFTAGNAFLVAYTAWFAANPDITGFRVIEIVGV